MPNAKCPKCQTLVAYQAGQKPVCPSCGFGAPPAPAKKKTIWQRWSAAPSWFKVSSILAAVVLVIVAAAMPEEEREPLGGEADASLEDSDDQDEQDDQGDDEGQVEPEPHPCADVDMMDSEKRCRLDWTWTNDYGETVSVHIWTEHSGHGAEPGEDGYESWDALTVDGWTDDWACNEDWGQILRITVEQWNGSESEVISNQTFPDGPYMPCKMPEEAEHWQLHVNATGAVTVTTTPVEAPAASLAAAATVSDDSPCQRTEVSIDITVTDQDGAPAGDVDVQSSWHYATTTPTEESTTGSDGTTTHTRNVGNATPEYQIIVEVVATKGDLTTTTQTSFTPQDC